jgi:hypothetical protein
MFNEVVFGIPVWLWFVVIIAIISFIVRVLTKERRKGKAEALT